MTTRRSILKAIAASPLFSMLGTKPRVEKPTLLWDYTSGENHTSGEDVWQSQEISSAAGGRYEVCYLDGCTWLYMPDPVEWSQCRKSMECRSVYEAKSIAEADFQQRFAG